MIAEVAERRDEITTLCQHYGVRRLELFGSAATGSFDSRTSDIDFLVDYPEDHDFGLWMVGFFDLKDDLRDLFGRPVDLVMTDATNDDEFWASVNASRETIYDAAPIPAVVGRHHPL